MSEIITSIPLDLDKMPHTKIDDNGFITFGKWEQDHLDYVKSVKSKDIIDIQDDRLAKVTLPGYASGTFQLMGNQNICFFVWKDGYGYGSGNCTVAYPHNWIFSALPDTYQVQFIIGGKGIQWTNIIVPSSGNAVHWTIG